MVALPPPLHTSSLHSGLKSLSVKMHFSHGKKCICGIVTHSILLRWVCKCIHTLVVPVCYGGKSYAGICQTTMHLWNQKPKFSNFFKIASPNDIARENIFRSKIILYTKNAWMQIKKRQLCLSLRCLSRTLKNS